MAELKDDDEPLDLPAAWVIRALAPSSRWPLDQSSHRLAQGSATPGQRVAHQPSVQAATQGGGRDRPKMGTGSDALGHCEANGFGERPRPRLSPERVEPSPAQIKRDREPSFQWQRLSEPSAVDYTWVEYGPRGGDPALYYPSFPTLGHAPSPISAFEPADGSDRYGHGTGRNAVESPGAAAFEHGHALEPQVLEALANDPYFTDHAPVAHPDYRFARALEPEAAYAYQSRQRAAAAIHPADRPPLRLEGVSRADRLAPYRGADPRPLASKEELSAPLGKRRSGALPVIILLVISLAGVVAFGQAHFGAVDAAIAVLADLIAGQR